METNENRKKEKINGIEKERVTTDLSVVHAGPGVIATKATSILNTVPSYALRHKRPMV